MLTRGKWIGTLLLLSGVLWPTAGQAAPTATFVAHRGTSGGVNAAPVYVHFDATGTTSSIAGDKPFFDLLYEWDFGDPTSGLWATDGTPRNRALGGVAGHVFEKSGSYVVRLTVTDRTGAKSTFQRTVTVDDPNVVWPVTNRTACISSTGNFTDCPAAGAARFTSSTFGSALTNALNAGYRRILFRRGDSFTGGGYTAPNTANVLVGAYGTGARPLINFTGGSSVAALGVTGNDWRVQDLEFQPGPAGSSLHGISTDAEVNDFLILRNRIIVATDRDDIFTPTNGPPFVSDRIAIVDNDLRGNVNAVTLGSSSGACYYGGSYQNFFAGNTCGKSSAWQIRIIFNDRSMFQHNVIQENGGAFECVKYHCAGDQSVVCRNNVVSDNVCMKERFNVTAGRAEDGNTIIDSVFERNMVLNGDIITEQPGNLFRHNVVGRFRLGARVFNATFSRNNQYVNNTCYSPQPFSQCFLALPGSDATGTVLRNNLFWAQGAPTPTISLIQGTGGGAMSVSGNQVVTGATSPFVSSTPRRLADFALRTGSTFVNGGIAGSGPTIDLVGNIAPLGLPDVGAVEFGSSGPVVVDAPPAPPVLLSVDVQP
jgi:hypothetical protein